MRVAIKIFLLTYLILLCGGMPQSVYAQDPNLSFLSINILQAAEERLDPEVNSIFILPGSSILSCTFTGIDSNGNIIIYEPENSKLASNTISSFSKTLQNTPSFQLNTDSSGIQSGDLLDWQVIDSLCAQKKTDALLCLEKIRILCHASIDAQSELFPYSYNTGSFSEEFYYIDQYSCEYRTSAITEWRLYIPISRKVKGWEIQIADTCNSLSSGSTHMAEFNESDLSMLTKRITLLCGSRFAHYISPTWTTVERSFYAEGNRYMKRAAKYIRKGNVRDAALLWKKVARTSHGKIAQYARFNLILVSEIRGQAEEAYWAALDLWKKSKLPEAYIYAEILKNCMDNEQKVRAQIRP